MNADDDRDRSWKLGVFYYNSDDQRVLVPKRLGFGRTLNMAKPISWVFLLGPIVVALVAAHFGTR
jgi:uncharacterized membrane protein